jgi:integrase
MSRKIDYLFLRPGSRNWHIKLQSPTGRTEKSLKTPDRVQAELLALPLIAEHKAELLKARPRIEWIWHHQYGPGREHIDPDGSITRTAANGEPAPHLVGLERRLGLTVPVPFEVTEAGRPTLATKSADDAILETYLKHANVTGYYEREARTVWALFKSLCDKPLKEATRDDGRKIVQHFEGQGLKSASIRKKIGWLTAAVNLAIKEGRLTFNPFSSVVPKRDDEEKRLPLDEADIRNAKRNLGQLDKSEQLLFRLLAATGMRLSEAFEIDGEKKERGCRYVIVGHKTPQSHRRIPLPATVLPFLPPTIKGPLFRNSPRTASKRLNRFLNEIGIADRRKVIHSLRHRAQDRLRAAGCPVDYRWALLGHEEKTVAESYGLGFPVPMLKKWIDKIGF